MPLYTLHRTETKKGASKGSCSLCVWQWWWRGHMTMTPYSQDQNRNPQSSSDIYIYIHTQDQSLPQTSSSSRNDVCTKSMKCIVEHVLNSTQSYWPKLSKKRTYSISTSISSYVRLFSRIATAVTVRIRCKIKWSKSMQVLIKQNNSWIAYGFGINGWQTMIFRVTFLHSGHAKMRICTL